jgi:hypothetical protein
MDCPPTPPNLSAGLRSPEPTAKMNEELPRDSASPEPNCTICLGPLTDQSNTDICAHKFCFNCIITWSKVKQITRLKILKFKCNLPTKYFQKILSGKKLPLEIISLFHNLKN